MRAPGDRGRPCDFSDGFDHTAPATAPPGVRHHAGHATPTSPAPTTATPPASPAGATALPGADRGHACAPRPDCPDAQARRLRRPPPPQRAGAGGRRAAPVRLVRGRLRRHHGRAPRHRLSRSTLWRLTRTAPCASWWGRATVRLQRRRAARPGGLAPPGAAGDHRGPTGMSTPRGSAAVRVDGWTGAATGGARRPHLETAAWPPCYVRFGNLRADGNTVVVDVDDVLLGSDPSTSTPPLGPGRRGPGGLHPLRRARTAPARPGGRRAANWAANARRRPATTRALRRPRGRGGHHPPSTATLRRPGPPSTPASPRTLPGRGARRPRGPRALCSWPRPGRRRHTGAGDHCRSPPAPGRHRADPDRGVGQRRPPATPGATTAGAAADRPPTPAGPRGSSPTTGLHVPMATLHWAGSTHAGVGLPDHPSPPSRHLAAHPASGCPGVGVRWP